MKSQLTILIILALYYVPIAEAQNRSHGRGFNNSGFGGGGFNNGGFGGGGFNNGGFGGGGFGGGFTQPPQISARGAEAGQQAAEKIAEKQKEISEQANERNQKISESVTEQQEAAQKTQQEFIKQAQQSDKETAKFLEAFGGIVSDNSASLETSTDYGSQVVQLINEGLQTQINALSLQSNFANSANQGSGATQGTDFSTKLSFSGGGAVSANANPVGNALATTNTNRNPLPEIATLNSTIGTIPGGTATVNPRGASANLPRGLKTDTYNFPKNFFE